MVRVPIRMTLAVATSLSGETARVRVELDASALTSVRPVGMTSVTVTLAAELGPWLTTTRV